MSEGSSRLAAWRNIESFEGRDRLPERGPTAFRRPGRAVAAALSGEADVEV